MMHEIRRQREWGFPALDVLQKLTHISSASQDPHGVNEAQGFLGALLKELGFKTQHFANSERETGELLFAERGPEDGIVMTMIGHIDCVQENSSGIPIKRDGRLLVGPGVADDKGGLVVALTGLYLFLKANPNPRLRFQFVSSPNEELGSTGFHHLFRKWGDQSQYVFGFEPALETGAPITTRYGNRWYRIRVTGESTHSGRVGRAEGNAAHELAAKLCELHKLHRPDELVKLNVGSLRGGTGKYNTTCGWAEALVDTRFASLEKRDGLHQSLEAILHSNLITDSKRVHCEYTIDDDCPPLSPTPESERDIKDYLDILTHVEGEAPKLEVTGGAADINYFCHPGATCIDGLGPVGFRLHRRDEAIVESSLYTRALALARILEKMNC